MKVNEKMKVNWRKLLLAVGVLAAVIAMVVGCSQVANDNESGDASSTSSTNVDVEVFAPGDENRVTTESADGIYLDVPLVDGPNVVGDSTDLVNVPPLVDTVSQCGALWDSWDDVVACKGNDEAYMSSYDLFSNSLGFNRADVERWATVAPDYNAQYILVSNWPEMENPVNARNALVNDGILTRDQANKLAVRVERCFINTRNLETVHPEPFADCKRKQVRITLAPLVLDKNNKVVKAKLGSGTLADCGNLWWKTVIRHTSTPPPPPPPPVVTTVTKPCCVITTTRPPMTTTTPPSTTTPPTTTPPTTTTPPSTTTPPTTTPPTTTTPPSTTLPPKPSTTNPQKPPGETTHPAPPRPVESVPPPPEPTPIQPELPTAAPTVAPPVNPTPPPPPVEPELPKTTTPPTTEIVRPGSAP